jgi:hypothetical protein
MPDVPTVLGSLSLEFILVGLGLLLQIIGAVMSYLGIRMVWSAAQSAVSGNEGAAPLGSVWCVLEPDRQDLASQRNHAGIDHAHLSHVQSDSEHAGELDLPREDILTFGTPHPNEISVNSTRVIAVHGIDVWHLTRAEITARRQLAQIARFLRAGMPGFEQSYVAQSGTTVGDGRRDASAGIINSPAMTCWRRATSPTASRSAPTRWTSTTRKAPARCRQAAARDVLRHPAARAAAP